MTSALQRFLMGENLITLERATSSVTRAGALIVERVINEVRVSVSNRLNEARVMDWGPPVTAEQLWPDTDKLIAACGHPQFTAMVGHPATARCDVCGESADASTLANPETRIRYVNTFHEWLN